MGFSAPVNTSRMAGALSAPATLQNSSFRCPQDARKKRNTIHFDLFDPNMRRNAGCIFNQWLAGEETGRVTFAAHPTMKHVKDGKHIFP